MIKIERIGTTLWKVPMQTKKILSYLLYAAAAIVLLFILLVEISNTIDISSPAKLLMSGLVITLLIAAALFRNATLDSPEQKRRTIRGTLWAAFLLYAVYLIWLLFFDNTFNRVGWQVDYTTYIKLKTNFTPFLTVHRYLKNISHGTQTGSAFLNLAGNLAAFAPLGFFGPALFRMMRKPWIFIPSLLVILVGVEGLQLLLRVGSCDVDDVILNLIGALLVYGLMKIPPIKRGIKQLY